MARLLLMTAGQTEWDRYGRIRGDLDVPLSDRGTAAVRKSADQIARHNLTAIYTSGGLCTSQTAEILAAPRGIPVKKRGAFRDLNCGLWQGLRAADVRRRFRRTYEQWQRSPVGVRPPQGETIEDAFERVRAEVQAILRRHPDDTVAIVTSKVVRALIQCFLKEITIDQLWEVCTEAAEWEIVEA